MAPPRQMNQIGSESEFESTGAGSLAGKLNLLLSGAGETLVLASRDFMQNEPPTDHLYLSARNSRLPVYLSFALRAPIVCSLHRLRGPADCAAGQATCCGPLPAASRECSSDGRHVQALAHHPVVTRVRTNSPLLWPASIELRRISS